MVQTSQKCAKSMFFNFQNLNVSNFLLFDQQRHFFCALVKNIIFILACQPEPNWPAIVTLMLSHDMKMSKVILLNFGAFVPGRGIDR